MSGRKRSQVTTSDDAKISGAPRAASTEATEDIFKLLVESVRDYAIFALDAGGHIMTWNAGAQRLKGYLPHEIIGKHFSVFYPQEAVDRKHPEYELRVATAEGRFEEEGWRVRKDGSFFWANVVITALRDENKELVGFAKVTRDLTERKAAEEALRDSEQRFRLIVQSVSDYGIFMLDPEGLVSSWNEGAERINGYTADEIRGQHFSVFYPEEDKAAGKPAMELRVATKVGRYEDEGWRIRKDGSRFWANVIITALHDHTGALFGFAKVTRDLTERKASEDRALADARRVAEAEAANRAKSGFLTAMSHELRTPLNAIGGYAELLTLGIHGPVTDAQTEALERIRAAQRHLLGLINDLLNFSKIEAGQITYDLLQVSLAEVAEAVEPLIEPQARARNITVDWQTADESVVAYADKLKVEQILLNLLTNAVKFTEAGGSVTITHFVHDDQAVLRVSDTGIGIPEEKLAAIFEPFVQVGRSLSSPHEGTGLGLAISRDLAVAMGGNLRVDSVLNRGSTFTLTLPRRPDSESQ